MPELTPLPLASPPKHTGPSPAIPKAEDAGMRATARALEATFIAEMLKHAGVGKTPEGFGGGAGEDQFAGFLRQEHAKAIAERGGIGLAEAIVEAMADRADDHDAR